MDYQEDKESAEASLAMSNVLHGVGISAPARRVHRTTIPYMNLIGKLEDIASGQQLLGIDSRLIGSGGEGLSKLPMISGTTCDVDMMHIFSKCEAYECSDVCVSQQHWQFQMEPCQNNSGYVKLKVIKEGTLLTLPISTSISDFFQYDAAFLYLSNSILASVFDMTKNQNCNQFFNSFQLADALQELFVTGPSISRKTRRDFGPGIFAINKIDNVFSIPCPTWPSVALEWIRRKRDYDWPTRNFILKHEQQGCYVVPVGCKECERKDLDWRVSFVLVEQALILDFNITQVNCLLLLKQLKTFVFEKFIGDIISSYILKTVVFWMIEESRPDLWVPHRLLTTVQLCLNKLISFVQNDFCPNFFIRTCNLLATRYTRTEKESVIQICLRARQDTRLLLCQTPPFKAFSSRHMEELALPIVDVCLSERLTQKICSVIICLMNDYVNMIFRLPLSSFQTLSTAIKYCKGVFLQLREMLPKYDIQQQDGANVIKQFRLMFIRLVWTNLYLRAQNNKCRYRCIRVLQYEFTEMNDLVESVTICHLNTAVGNYATSNEALKMLISKLKCLPYGRMRLPFDSFFNADDLTALLDWVVKAVGLLFDGNNSHSKSITDILFLRLEMDILPPPMQMEMCQNQNHDKHVDLSSSMSSTVAVDPLVYACFLRFWCCVKLDQNIEQLKARDDMVWCCGLTNITNKAVAYNLLGYCHKHLGEYDEAFRAFITAWKQNPRSDVTLVHMSVLVYSIIRRELNETSPG